MMIEDKEIFLTENKKRIKAVTHQLFNQLIKFYGNFKTY